MRGSLLITVVALHGFAPAVSDVLLALPPPYILLTCRKCGLPKDRCETQRLEWVLQEKYSGVSRNRIPALAHICFAVMSEPESSMSIVIRIEAAKREPDQQKGVGRDTYHETSSHCVLR